MPDPKPEGDGGNGSVWTVVHIAPNRALAEMVREMLEAAGLFPVVRPLGVPHLGDSRNFEILVPESEVADAQAALTGTLDENDGFYKEW